MVVVPSEVEYLADTEPITFTYLYRQVIITEFFRYFLFHLLEEYQRLRSRTRWK